MRPGGETVVKRKPRTSRSSLKQYVYSSMSTRSDLPSAEDMVSDIPRMDLLHPILNRHPFGHPSTTRSPTTRTHRTVIPATPREHATRLVEQFPQIDIPQRVLPPRKFNAPPRLPCTRESLDLDIGGVRAFSPVSKTVSSRGPGLNRSKYDIRSYAPIELDEVEEDDGSAPADPTSPPKRDRVTREQYNKLKDYNVMASACRRAGKHHMEAAAYMAMGITWDNLQEYSRAISCYEKMHIICEELGERDGVAIAFNSIGVDHHLRGLKKSGEEAQEDFKSALAHHEAHREIADSHGEFVAYSNQGLALCAMNEFDAACRAHQNALRAAIYLKSPVGQSIAVGNLGMVAIRQGDLATAKACLDQHLTLVKSIKDVTGEASALTQLGKVASETGDFAAASSYFEKARATASASGSSRMSMQAKANIGAARGAMVMEEFMESLSKGRLPASPMRRTPTPSAPSPTPVALHDMRPALFDARPSSRAGSRRSRAGSRNRKGSRKDTAEDPTLDPTLGLWGVRRERKARPQRVKPTPSSATREETPEWVPPPLPDATLARTASGSALVGGSPLATAPVFGSMNMSRPGSRPPTRQGSRPSTRQGGGSRSRPQTSHGASRSSVEAPSISGKSRHGTGRKFDVLYVEDPNPMSAGASSRLSRQGRTLPHTRSASNLGGGDTRHPASTPIATPAGRTAGGFGAPRAVRSAPRTAPPRVAHRHGRRRV